MKIAAIIPCYNEESSVGEVIKALKRQVSEIEVYVCDNGSVDRTIETAKANGAKVLIERKKGKGNAVRRLFRDVDADVYVMIDGDNTYGTEIIAAAIELITSGYDMVTGERMLKDIHQRAGHAIGNKLFTQFLRKVFNVSGRDVFSGLRIMSRRLVKTFPCLSLEFELEAELEIFCARMRLPVIGISTTIRERVNSESKLNTVRDGFKIALLSLRMLHREYPLKLYMALSLSLVSLGIAVSIPIIDTYLETGLVPRVPTLIVSASMFAIGITCLGVGLILKEITNSRYESRYLNYIRLSGR